MYLPPLPHNGVVSTFAGRYDESWSSLIGIVTAIVGNVLISFALNTQRYAHIKLDREWHEEEKRRKQTRSDTAPSRASEHDALLTPPHEKRQKSYLQSPYWWAGIVLMTVGEAGNFLAYGFAPASIVSPLGVVALISNCIIAPFMLKEPFRWRDAVGVIVAVGGAVTVVLSASDNNPKLGPDEIWALITRWEFETYLGVTTGVIVLLMGASNRYGDKNILVDLGLVGLFGGFTALSTKGVASLLSYTLWRVITFPVFYLLVAILVGTAVMQIKYINRALQRFDATQVIPVQFVLFTLSVILGSAILYRDFERTSGGDAGKFVGGCGLTFSGVWLITSGRPRRHDDVDEEEDEDREPESDEAIVLHRERYRDSISTASDTSSASTIRPASPLPITTPSINLTTPPPSTPPQIPHSSSALNSLIQTPSPSSHPPIHRHTSTPVLPSEAAPRTPSRGPDPLTPGSSSAQPGLRRLRTNERQRSTGQLLASPLSTGLSALVQGLKRGGGQGRRGSVVGIGGEEFGEPLRRGSTLGEVSKGRDEAEGGESGVIDYNIVG